MPRHIKVADTVAVYAWETWETSAVLYSILYFEHRLARAFCTSPPHCVELTITPSFRAQTLDGHEFQCHQRPDELCDKQAHRHRLWQTKCQPFSLPVLVQGVPSNLFVVALQDSTVLVTFGRLDSCDIVLSVGNCSLHLAGVKVHAALLL